MHLTNYLAKHGISYPKFARSLNVSPITVYRWAHGLRFPARHLPHIAAITGGAVTANDFVAVMKDKPATSGARNP